MGSLQFEIKGKQPDINEIQSLLGSVGGVKKSIGSRVTALLKANFTNLDNTRANKLGGKRTHTWADIGRSTSWEEIPEGVRITISDKRFRQRYQGGTIKPRNGSRYLTIPASARSYDKRAREFTNLTFKYVLRDGRLVPALVEKEPKAKQRKGKGLRGAIRESVVNSKVLYWLVRQAKQAPDPSALPKQKEIERTIIVAIEEYLAAVKETRKPATA